MNVFHAEKNQVAFSQKTYSAFICVSLLVVACNSPKPTYHIETTDSESLGDAGQLYECEDIFTDNSPLDADIPQRTDRDIDVGTPCSRAEDCPQPLGCVKGRCDHCTSGEDCRISQKEGCVDGECGRCMKAEDCAPGLGCRRVTGECDICRSMEDCRQGEACIEEACSDCNSDTQCEGFLCTDGKCTKCNTDDECRQGYGKDFQCCIGGNDPMGFPCNSGSCIRTKCETAEDCKESDPRRECFTYPTSVCENGYCHLDRAVITGNMCYIGGQCFKPLEQPAWAHEDKFSCLYCQPGVDPFKWTPYQRQPGDPQTVASWCFISDMCRKQGEHPGTGNGENDRSEDLDNASCLHCSPEPSDTSTLFSWSPVWDPPDPEMLGENGRTYCPGEETGGRPSFDVPDGSGGTNLSTVPPYSGTPYGYCWKGVCRGIAWNPWLPVGWNSAAVSTRMKINGEDIELIGTMGGGFGLGIPNANMGCSTSNCP